MRTILLKAIFALFVLVTLSSCKKDRRALVVGKIHEASKLATTEFTIDKIVHGTKSKRIFWLVKLNEARFLAYSQAIVKVGVDLNKMKSDDIKMDKKKIELLLPQVEVINFSYPPDKFRLDTEITENKFLNKISLEDQEEYFRQAELDIRNNLEYMRVVETTQQHTRTMLKGLLKSLGYTEIYIRFEEGPLVMDRVVVTIE